MLLGSSVFADDYVVPVQEKWLYQDAGDITLDSPLVFSSPAEACQALTARAQSLGIPVGSSSLGPYEGFAYPPSRELGTVYGYKCMGLDQNNQSMEVGHTWAWHACPVNFTPNGRTTELYIAMDRPPATTCTMSCGEGQMWNPEKKGCYLYGDRVHEKPAPQFCPIKYAHPIYPLTGSKGLTEELGNWRIGGQRVAMAYDTRSKVPSNNASLAFGMVASPSFGELWASTLHKSLVLRPKYYDVRSVQASRGAGAWVSFQSDGAGHYTADADVSDRLVAVGGGWRYIDAAARSEETYDVAGQLLNVVYAGGARLDYTYSDATTPVSVAPVAGLLIKVQDQQGRSVQFQYEQPAGVRFPRIRQVIDPAGLAIGIAYDAGNNLTKISWPDGKSRQHLHERSDIPWAVTGTIDENATRLATYGYDAQGRANDTQWAGGVDHYRATYTTPPSWSIVETYDSATETFWRDHRWQAPQGLTITDPSGNVSTLTTTLVQGMPRLTAQSQPAGSGCSASTSEQAYDANGNTSQRDDFNQTRTCYANDLARNLETVRVEGLAKTTMCNAVTPANAALPAGSRKVSTEWHPDWRIERRRAEPGRLTTLIYNGQPDPFNGNAVASCAPTTAKLPDDKPIVVLCKQVEQATTDTDGSKGFSAPLQAGVVNRVSSWTYNASGQVLSSKGSRTDVDGTTRYTYYTDTTADHAPGDLMQVTSAANRLTQFTKYDKTGQVLESKDDNGVVTVYTYDLRQRLKTATVGGRQTKYDYDAVGQLKKVTQPDTSWIGFDYDDAHRQSAVYDHLGNRIEYTLDKLGNRTFEKVKDPGNALKRQLQRSIDALGRVQQTTGR